MSSRTRFIDNALLTVLVSLGLLFLVARGCSFATAQERRPLTAQVALARLCISEAGWECWDTGDGFGIHEVVLRGAAQQRLRYENYARAYARRLFGARPHDVQRLRWVGQLTPECSEPEAWPETMTVRRGGRVEVVPHAPWSAYRERCRAVFERAAEVAREHTIDDIEEWGICDRPVHDWGGTMDRLRAERIGLVAVPCGTGESHQGTRNDFYCRPSLDPDCVEQDRE